LVEDNEADVDLARETFSRGRIGVDLSVARDGVDALDFLLRRRDHARAPRPDLVLLDLNLPKLDGKGVLAAMKENPALRSIPVVVLSGSDADADVCGSYGLGANCYVTKPAGLAAFQGVVRSIEDFWLEVVELPRSGG